MRLFVGVWPSAEVLDTIEAMPRVGDARWTRREQWHVTLKFLGEVPEEEVAAAINSMRAVAATCAPRVVTLGPATKVLGRGVLMLPVTGLDDVAAKLRDDRFTGHLTLARHASRDLAGTPLRASWEAQEIALIRSHLGAGPARYETLAFGAFAP